MRAARKRLVLAAATTVVALGGLFLLAEVALRSVRDPVDLRVLTGRTIGANPNRDWGQVDAFCAYRGRTGDYTREGVRKTVNSHGFISTPELAVQKPDGMLRIAYLGGSSTAGTGHTLPDTESWPSVATALLRRRLPDRPIEFINGALGGYTSFESFGRLWSRIRFFSPDIVVVYHGWNEMYYFDTEDMTRWRTLPDGSWSFDTVPQPITTYEPLGIDPLIRHSQILTKIRLRFSRMINGEVGSRTTELAQDYDHRGLDVFRTNLQLLRTAAELVGATLFVAKQATLIVPDLPRSERERCRYGYHGFDHDAHVDAFARIYDVIDDEIEADHVIDATTLSGVPAYFEDHVHPTGAGSRALAEVVADAIHRHLTDGDTQ